ncbi:MAG: acyl-CoA thioesterase [bacterium]
MFTYHTTIRLHDTDAAGFLFFSNQFKIAHDAFEGFLESINFSCAFLLKKADFLLPIVHAEADYRASLFVGDRITVRIQPGDIGSTSFSLLYDFINQDGRSAGKVKTVHVAVSKEHGGKISLPERLRVSLMELG